MKRLLVLGLLVSPFPPQALHAGAREALPVEPIESRSYQGWDEALRIFNDRLEVVAVPAIGRIVSISSIGGENLLRFNEDLAGDLPPQHRESDWYNYGGDWLWPVAQARWGEIGEGTWPPPRLLSGRPWKGRAWKDEDGSQVISLRQAYGAPLHVEVERRIVLPGGSADTLTVYQEVERIAESDIPVTLWQISQVEGAEEAYLARSDESAFDRGYKQLGFDEPDDEVLTVCPSAVAYRAGIKGQHKIGTDAPAGWVAAVRDSSLLIEQASGDASDGVFPDGGCRSEIYSNAGLGYTEIETLSPERTLAVGETMSNTLSIRLVTFPLEFRGCRAAEEIRPLLPLAP